jgi:hypothetical protein
MEITDSEPSDNPTDRESAFLFQSTNKHIDEEMSPAQTSVRTTPVQFWSEKALVSALKMCSKT